MAKYAALLRGIGPGNPNMRNDKLRGVFESLGFLNVQTVISSGNVLFESNSADIPALEEKIEKAISSRLGFHSTTIIRSLEQLQQTSANDPFADIEHSPTNYLTVTFLKKELPTDLRLPYQPPGKSYTLLAMRGQAIYSVVDLTGSRAPDFMVWLEKQFSKEITTRTWKTVNRILAKLDTPQAK